jgi:hypothetical protein
MANDIGTLRLRARASRLIVRERSVLRSIPGRGLSCRMQSFEKRHEGGGLRRAQILSVRWHVAPSLNNLPDELIRSEAYGDGVQSGTPLPTQLSKRMAVAALLDLKDERTLPLKRGRTVQISLGDRVAAPGVHVRTPRSKSREMRECSQCYRYQQNG